MKNKNYDVWLGIGLNILHYRKEQGLTQKDLALTTGVGLRLIVELEKGSRGVKIDTIIKICQFLGLKVDIS